MKNMFLMVFTLCVLLISCITVSAVEEKTLGFPVQSASEQEKEAFADKTNLKLIQEESRKIGISSFDISGKGMIALAFDSSTGSNVYVYDPNGEFQYGYSFYSDGVYGIGFVDENIAIYFLRGDTIAIYDPDGSCLDVQKIIKPNQHNALVNQIIDRTSKYWQGKSYVLERDVNVGSTYSRLVVIDEDGTRNVIYDISTEHTVGNIFWIVSMIGFVVLVIVIALIKDNPAKNKPREGTWFCEEIQMQVSYDDPKNAYIIVNGEKIRCRCENYFGGREMEVLCQELEHPTYGLGKTIFIAEVIEFDNSTMVVFQKETQQKYVFIRSDLKEIEN